MRILCYQLFYVFLQIEMRHALNTFVSAIMLTMILLGTSGVSLEKCSCTGKISLVLLTEGDCCPDEGGCMTVKSMQLSDYMPTMNASLDIPMQPVLFPVIPPTATTSTATTEWQLESHCAQAPPGELAHTVSVLRV